MKWFVLMSLVLCIPLVAGWTLACATPPKVTPAASWWAWVVPGQLIGAAAPERVPGGLDSWLTTLEGAARDAPLAVLNLRQERYPARASRVTAVLHLPITDFSPPSRAQADAALAFIDEQLGLGRIVVVHCHGGCGRSGTILAAWLKRREGLSASEAIARLQGQRSCFVETPAQEAFVDSY